jgi:putative ABC transport system ATP-binding protein
MSILLKDIRKSFGETPVLSIDHLEIPGGSEWVITGKSGSGKTTFLNLIAGILLPDRGQVMVEGTDISLLPETKRDLFRARKIGFVFQTFHLLPGFTALENVQLGMLFAGKRDRAKAEGLLERVGLADRMRYHPAEMSVGQQQRVAIARALANDPALILADEPTGNLDPETGVIVLDLLREMCSTRGTTLVAVTHQPQVVEAFPKTWNLSES